MNVSVIGMGFVGIPLATAFDGAGYDVVGYDIDQQRVEALQHGRDPTDELDPRRVQECDVEFTDDPADIGGFDYAILTVPTPIDEWKQPNFDAITNAARTVGDQLTRGATVVLESTVYPGATRDVLIPTLEQASGLQAGDDFSVGYSPERIAPNGAGESELRQTNKVVSAQDEETLDDLLTLYESVIDATVEPAPTIETAEASKCLENVQRDVNIALVNEFVMGCQNLDIDIDPHEVLDAARTKAAFHDYSPGLVGGHCIPVDPYFLMKRFDKSGFHPTVMERARRTNEQFPAFLARRVVKNIDDRRADDSPSYSRRLGNGDASQDGHDAPPRALLLGVSYKANVSDIRNRALTEFIRELDSYGLQVYGHDPLVQNQRLEDRFGITSVSDPTFSAFDCVIVTAFHDEFRSYDLGQLLAENEGPYLLDLTGEVAKHRVGVTQQ